MLRLIGRIFGAAAVLLALAAGPVGASDLYTVDKLPIDAVGTSPSEARDKAMAAGRMKAFGIVFKRLTAQTNWGHQPKPTPEELEEMVTSFVVENERHSTTRYLADATYTLSPGRVRSVMQRASMVFSETSAKPVAILPLKPGVGWATDTLWASSWNSVARRGSLRPVIVPIGDAADMAMVGSVIADSASWRQVSQLADKYGATEVWLTTATKTAAGLSVSVVSLKSDVKRESRFNIIANAGEADPQLHVRAAAMVRASFEESWKAQTAVDYGMRGSLEAAVAFSGLPDWVSIRNELNDIRLIQRVNVDQMLTQGARLRLDYVGKIDQLRGTLRQANLTLEDNGSGLYILSRPGADTSLLPAELLAPPTDATQVPNPYAIPGNLHSKPGIEGEAPPSATPAQIPSAPAAPAPGQ